jgi:hypothetical protein
MNTAMTLRVPLNIANFLTSWATVSLSKMSVFPKLSFFIFIAIRISHFDLDIQGIFMHLNNRSTLVGITTPVLEVCSHSSYIRVREVACAGRRRAYKCPFFSHADVAVSLFIADVTRRHRSSVQWLCTESMPNDHRLTLLPWACVPETFTSLVDIKQSHVSI